MATSTVDDKEGNVTKQFDGKGQFTLIAYDALNRRKTVTDRLNGVTKFFNKPGKTHVLINYRPSQKMR